MREVDGRQLIPAEAERIRAPQDILVDQRNPQGRRRTEPIQQESDELVARARPRLHEIGERMRPAGLRQRIDSCGELCQRLVPRDFLILTAATGARSLHRVAEAIRVIGHLDRGLAACAQPAAVDRMCRQSFELLRDRRTHDTALAVANDVHVRVHHAYLEAAAGRTERADRRLPRRHAGHEVVVRDEPDDLVFGMTAVRQRRAGAGDRRHLEEPSSIHG